MAWQSALNEHADLQPAGNDGGFSRTAPVGYHGAERRQRLRRDASRRLRSSFCRSRALGHAPEATVFLPSQRTFVRPEARQILGRTLL